MRLEHIWLMMTQTLHQHEVVHIVVPNERGQEHVYQQVAHYGFDQSNIDICVFPTDEPLRRSRRRLRGYRPFSRCTFPPARSV